MKTYPLYFQALVARDDTIVRKSFPAFFYADISESILESQAGRWLMRPPGSVVVLGGPEPAAGRGAGEDVSLTDHAVLGSQVEAVDSNAPKGSPQVIDMIETGIGWMPYRIGPSSGVNCAGVRYPA